MAHGLNLCELQALLGPDAVVDQMRYVEDSPVNQCKIRRMRSDKASTTINSHYLIGMHMLQLSLAAPIFG